jgi:hypothetical protein
LRLRARFFAFVFGVVGVDIFFNDVVLVIGEELWDFITAGGV